MQKFPQIIYFFFLFIIFIHYIESFPIDQNSIKDTEKNQDYDLLSKNNENKNIKEKKVKNKKRLINSEGEEGLDEEEAVKFLPLKIYLDLFNFNYTYPNNTIPQYKDNFYTAMNIAKSLLEKIITMKTNIYIIDNSYEEQHLEEWKIQYWNATIFEEFMNLTEYNYYILFRFDDTTNTVASSYICDEFESPAVGVITINPVKILEKPSTEKYLTNLLLKQYIHLLGFQIQDNDFDNYIVEKEGDNYFIKEESSPKLFEYVHKYFGCQSINRIDLETDEDGNIHWPSRQFLGEIMTIFDYPEEKVLSEFTLAYLEDLGYYKIDNKYTGGLMKFGKKKGCKFFNGNCGRNLEGEADAEGEEGVNDIKIVFANEFYLPNSYTPHSEPSCSSSRLSKTIYRLHAVTSEDNIANLEYITSDGLYTGVKSTNYCPIAEFNSDSSSNLYTGSCSDDETPVDISLNEKKGNNSFCVLRSLENNEIRAACYQMFCSSQSLTILIGSNYIVCPRSGGKVQLKETNYYILCPDYNLICSGNKPCNNMINCIENGSEEKPSSHEYDYTIKTSQNYENYKNDPIITEEAWELSQDGTGTCPYLCMQCNSNRICSKCKPYYKIYSEEENECHEIVPNCAQYDENNREVCIACNEHYSLVLEDNNTYICIHNDEINAGDYFFPRNRRQFL